MREIRQSGSEGGVAVTRHPYPYYGSHLWCWGRGEPRIDADGRERGW